MSKKHVLSKKQRDGRRISHSKHSLRLLFAMARARKYRSLTNTTDFIRKTDLNCISAPTPLFCSSWIKACFPAWINPAMRSGSYVASVSKVLNTKPWKEQRKHSTINYHLKSPHYFLFLEFFFGWPLVSTLLGREFNQRRWQRQQKRQNWV